ncbi:uncharacterized protein LY89DRAFT_783649 [Mollisia scopiformis]|uniref:Uncharacterized protein n=1 Tax=Mollisia scopiformis TaxID=149040 RepID=A0A194X5Q9_MOLSC|nr:uncharacterized protein LY89DRAFT_783649 [Mollisia scopiformis]KUJ15518.1 hypothetical protein LY89DRAFT_783649 [Mollisia scopiformis]
MAPRTRNQAHQALQDASAPAESTSNMNDDGPRRRTRQDPTKKASTFDDPLPSVEDEEVATSSFAQAQVAADEPITSRLRSRSRSTSVVPTTRTTYNRRASTRSQSPSQKANGSNKGKRGVKRGREDTHDDDDEEDGLSQSNNKKSRGNNYEADMSSQPSQQPTRAGRGGRGGGRGRGARKHVKLPAIQEASPARAAQQTFESPAETNDLTSIVPAIQKASPAQAQETFEYPAEPKGLTSILSPPSDVQSLRPNRFHPYKRSLSPLKHNQIPNGYESLSDDDSAPAHKPGDPAWWDKKQRIKSFTRFVNDGVVDKALKNKVQEVEPETKQRMPSNSTSVQRKKTLRTVAEWATSDASNKLPTAGEMVSFLEQTKTRNSANIATLPKQSNAGQAAQTSEAAESIPQDVNGDQSRSYAEIPGKTFQVPDESDSEDDIMSNHNETAADAESDHASSPHITSPQIPTTPTTPTPTLLPKAEEPQGWLGSAKKAILNTTFKFFGRGSQNDSQAGSSTATTATSKFTFTSQQKIPQTPTPSIHGGRAQRKTPQTERPRRINKALIPPERFVPNTEYRKKKAKKLPIEQRGVISPKRRAELQAIQAEKKRQQREAEETRVELEEWQRVVTYKCPSETSSDEEDGAKKDESEGSDSQEFDPDNSYEVWKAAEAKKAREAKPKFQCPEEPERDWKNDDKWGFTYQRDGKRYSRLDNIPNRIPGMFRLRNLPQHPKLALDQVPAHIQQWIAEHDAWERIYWGIRNDEVTQVDIDKYNQMIRDNELGRQAEEAEEAKKAAAPPPAPRPANAELPAQSAPAAAMAKATKYAPKTPSGLRNAERAYSSPVDSENEVVEKLEDTTVDAGERILQLVHNRNEKVPELRLPELMKNEDIVVPAWLKAFV